MASANKTKTPGGYDLAPLVKRSRNRLVLYSIRYIILHHRLVGRSGYSEKMQPRRGSAGNAWPRWSASSESINSLLILDVDENAVANLWLLLRCGQVVVVDVGHNLYCSTVAEYGSTGYGCQFCLWPA